MTPIHSRAMKLIRMKNPLSSFSSTFAGPPIPLQLPNSVDTSQDCLPICRLFGGGRRVWGAGPRIHWLIRITAGHPQSTCPALTSTTCFWFALPAAVKARAPKARLHGSRQGKPHPRKPVPVCLQYVCQPKSGCQSTLQKPAKCRCKNLQNRSAITYIFNLQLSAKRGCKKQ